MQTVLLVVQVCVCLGLVGLVLIQHGKGADAGAAFGSGASSTVFGARGATSFLTRATGTLAVVFFVNSLGLAYLSSAVREPEGLMERMESVQSERPAQPMAPSEDIPASGAPADVPTVSE